jgi:hypothetical protein
LLGGKAGDKGPHLGDGNVAARHPRDDVAIAAWGGC